MSDCWSINDGFGDVQTLEANGKSGPEPRLLLKSQPVEALGSQCPEVGVNQDAPKVGDGSPGKKSGDSLMGGTTPEASMFLVPKGFSGPDISFQKTCNLFTGLLL